MSRGLEALEEKRSLERETLIVTIDQVLQTPMVILSFIMLGLFLIELSLPVSPDWRRTINLIQWFIWVAFVIEFIVKIAIAPKKINFVRRNWLTALAVVLPVLRVFQVAKAARAVRSMGALRVIAVGNRSIIQVGRILGRRHIHYVIVVVVLVTVLGGAGIFFLERSVADSTIRSFGAGLWWTVGAVTTVGTELYPVSAEGRVLAAVIMVFGVSVFGYVAGSLASVFIHVDTRTDEEEEKAAASHDTEDCSPELLQEIKELHEQLEQLATFVSQTQPRRPNP